MSLHCIRGCVVPRRHLQRACGCDCHQGAVGAYPCSVTGGCAESHEAHSDECPGCEPRRSADGMFCCYSCASKARTALDELPGLWADLAEKPQTAGLSSMPRDKDDTPGQLIGDQALTLRSAIRAHLVSWVQILESKHGMPIPAEESVIRGARLLVAHHTGLASQARQAALLMRMPAIGPFVQSEEGYRRLKDEEKQHLRKVAGIRADREAGTDMVRALAEHLKRHLERLLADEDDAPVLLDDLLETREQARRLANRGRGANLRILCSCGTRVPVDQEEIMTCAGCGDYGVLSWWVKQEANMAEQPPMTLTELYDWLILQGVAVHPRRLRDWADNGEITAVDGGGPGVARRFDPAAVLIVATSPRRTRRKTSAKGGA